MKALIVYAHPEPKSFNGAMKDLAVETLRGRGDEVEVTDLYAMRFKAVVGADDFHGERVDPEFLSIAAEQTRACETEPSRRTSSRAEEARARRDSHSAVSRSGGLACRPS
jgi:putative NADPH-quinone reductase